MSSSPSTNRINQVSELLGDPHYDRPSRLVRLQGWRGDEVTNALDAGLALRLGPATCSVLAAAVAITGSAGLAAFTALTAVIGALASHHPIETAYNLVGPRVGLAPLPSNRAAKRLGCAIGSVFFLVSAIGYATGYLLVGLVPALMMAGLAAFVAVSNVCVPSIVFTFLWGSERATAASLIDAAKRR